MVSKRCFLNKNRVRKLLSSVNGKELYKNDLKLNIECSWDNGINTFTRALLKCRDDDAVIIGSTQEHALVKGVESYCSTISTSDAGLPHIVYFRKCDGDKDFFVTDLNTGIHYEILVRRLTPRECFRLMGVKNDDIDKIYSIDMTNMNLLHLAGNSIVVDVLEQMFKNMFIYNFKEESLF